MMTAPKRDSKPANTLPMALVFFSSVHHSPNLGVDDARIWAKEKAGEPLNGWLSVPKLFPAKEMTIGRAAPTALMGTKAYIFFQVKLKGSFEVPLPFFQPGWPVPL